MIKFNKKYPDIVIYTPTENDINHLNTIREFLNFRQIPFEGIYAFKEFLYRVLIFR